MVNQKQQPQQQQQQIQPQDLAAVPAPALSPDPAAPVTLEPNENLEKLMLMQQQALEGHA